MAQVPSSTCSILIWHAAPDVTLCQKLAQHLDPLVKNRRITLWHKGLLLGGADQEAEMERRVNGAHVLLVLVSADSLIELEASQSVQLALLRHQRDEGLVIPVLLRPALWDESPLAELMPLPRDRRPVTQWEDPEAALLEIAQAVESLLLSNRLAGGTKLSGVQRKRVVAAGSILGVGLIVGAVALGRQTVELDTNEVTNADFARWLNGRRVAVDQARLIREGEVLLADLYRDAGGGSGLREEGGQFEALEGMERLPVVQVSYAAAERYCAARNARLPRSAEWMAAACGRWQGHWLARLYPWGDEAPRCDGVVYGRHNGVCQHLPQGPVAVGTAAQDRTPQGLRDLGGNVAEWVAGHQVWGGDYARGVTECQDLRRSELPADAVRGNIGFRCAW